MARSVWRRFRCEAQKRTRWTGAEHRVASPARRDGPFARHKHRRERPPSFPAESSRLPKSEGMATVAMRAVAPAAARASAANDRAGGMTRQNAGACFEQRCRCNRARERLERREGARANAANARARPARAARDARAPSRALLAAPNVSRGARRADYGKPCAPSARGVPRHLFCFSIWRARRRRSGARAPPRRLPVAPETRSIERSRANRAASGREPERLTRTLSDRTPRPHPICCRLVRPETVRLLTRSRLRRFRRFFSSSSDDPERRHHRQARRDEGAPRRSS